MKFKTDFFKNYLREAPVALALERSLECQILSRQKFQKPLLDIGCGEGLFSYILFDEKIDVGIDPNAEELKRAEQYGMYEEYLPCSGDRIPKADKSFKTIMSNSVLEHIPDIESVIREAHRLLADDGVFYVTIPSDQFDRYSNTYQILKLLRLNSFAEKFRLFFNRFWKHYHFYSPQDWAALFQKNGFELAGRQEYCPKTICLLNNFLAPFAFFSFIIKKKTNRWFLFPKWRRYFAGILFFIYKPFLKQDPAQKNGGILFFAFKKSSVS